MPKRVKPSKARKRAAAFKRTARKPKAAICILGAGRVGTALGLALSRAGYRIELVVSRRKTTAHRAERLIGGSAIGLSAEKFANPSANERLLLNHCSVILVTTPDDTIAGVTRQLRKTFAESRQPRIALHTSGALGSEVLKPLRAVGFSVGSLHPLLSVSDSRNGARLLTGAFFSVEGDPGAVRTARAIVRDLGAKSFTLKTRSKALYHAAALMVSPNLTALFDIALEMLGKCGVSPNRARQILLPLVDSTVNNLLNETPAAALTGTFKRGDVATVRKHLTAIQAAKLQDALAAYIVLGRRSVELAGSDKTVQEHRAEIIRLLNRAASSKSQ
jgi:predicted short-subunit dehydrogenase-like oxidoreductase (DUF2520 family)